ncbi:MAG: hypothetical protein COT33_00525 [Candidatus Nealsonbacteria bacterium CG08_land_8_20_14_0_20_38_20]|uniref:Uncharacterized protein n=1 Tax=Candidatus Nealsonbacteria bacterium CG08_land_8_20_14_0_20_38_20 TaxID=1974705 RepID=A0A2H0YMI6_9BACT|nr:MAG: hypothetical protein COT33_00525 [Candidatus Nealsonbacteria bacterium CG08_land_8_20_14_0_20_38_20]
MRNQNKTLERMGNKIIIDTENLPKDGERVLTDLIEILIKKRIQKKKVFKKIKKPEIKFRDWVLNTRRKLTREEIYDHL